MSAKAPRTGRLARGAIAGLAVARAGAAHLSHRAQALARSDDRVEQAQIAHQAKLGRILFAALNQLKGTALKASQLLSLELGLLPEGLREELAKAHYQVTPLNRALVIKLLRQEFGQGPDELFAQFEPGAFAAASLGQVHGATLKSGEAVAVKLQYPGMAASIGSDMAMLRTLLQTLGRGSDSLPKADIVERVLADIEAKLAEELDYLHEAEQMLWFRQAFAGRPSLVVPQTFFHLSSKRVLTMQRLPGMHLNEWLATGPSQTERDHFGQLLFDNFLFSLFELKRLQADPHPGNYLFMADGRLGLLDFGCTRKLSEPFCAGIGGAWSALLRRPCDLDRLQQVYLELGLIAAGLSKADFREQLMPALAQTLAWQTAPFAVAVYDFGQHPVMPRPDPSQQRQAVHFLQSMTPELPYFDRAYLGLVLMLKSLGARVNTSNRWISADQSQTP
ncbi:ABC1 kinase family protein [Roseateles oligotrophus]|uniref:AarF/ABC1/UbiB kinase family protein n=1 Tax=Roseateles oligotrophus TaxID=1769250 RepID=A0ABT2YKP9_9BURK|nr:AarF/ABC1/UbiB kinase family protein [Roseateles oligotrophus]MCV2370628.1 AarF/ABC1/UbiB kinase family protein [Roseateles oligotrophus]